MPVSDVANISPIMQEVQRLQPSKVMDLGIGVGKYGVLCREVLDGVRGLVNQSQYDTIIHGVEGFDRYRNPAWSVYDHVEITDIVEYYTWVKDYDLVLMIDSLEHLEPAVGATVLRYLVEHNKNVIVSVPLGECPQGTCFGNHLETHRTTFTGSEFSLYKYRVLYRGVCLVVSINGVRE